MKKIIDNILIIKVGTSSLTKTLANGQVALDIASFRQLGEQIAKLRENNYHIAIVSSAAITAGMVDVGLAIRPDTQSDMPNLQRLASIGWRHVLNAWSDALRGISVGELLLTRRELESHREEAEALRVSYELMLHGNIPIINENDAITHEEIAFGDNDTLAAIFTSKIKQSRLFGNKVSLIILSDVHGVYADIDDERSIIKKIDDIAAYQNIAHQSSSSVGTGGMITKFAAARIVHECGADMYIANGRTNNALEQVLRSEIGTHFKV